MGVRGGVTRRQIWQGFLDWLRPVDHHVSASQRAMNPARASSDLVAPLALIHGTSTSELAGEMSADQATGEIDEGELLEFLAADHDPVPADAAFREQLRDQLWAFVQGGALTRSKDQ